MGHSARFLYFASPFPDLSVRGARASGTWPLSEEWSGDSRALNPIGRRWASEEKGRTGEISGSAIPGARVTKTNGRLGIAPHCCVADDAAVRERKKKVWAREWARERGRESDAGATPRHLTKTRRVVARITLRRALQLTTKALQ